MKVADVAFMHGGLATIKESIWEQVPIVIVPLGKDQRDNALRIKRSGVGVAAEVADLSPHDLRKLLTAGDVEHLGAPEPGQHAGDLRRRR